MVETSSLSHPSVPSCPPDHPRGRPFGDYELLEPVGRGGMAEVWLARRRVMTGALKPCALKIIHGRFAARPRHRRMFLQESRLALKLRHANVVSVFDAGEVEGRLYMALEWVDGVDLRCFVQRVQARLGALSVPVVCHIVLELLQALRHAHGLCVGGRSLGVIHRDIAPHNVLVSAAGEVKLADFGIARVGDDPSSGMYVKGRARYMAPERLRGEATPASDLFAIGAIVHELLEGRRFREDLSQRQDWHQVVAQAAVPPLSRTDVPPSLEALRVGLLCADPRHRIASADDALRGLLGCPPWPPGTNTLRVMYAHCIGAPRRTGLTCPHSPPPGARRPRSRLASAPHAGSDALPSARARSRDAPRAREVAVPAPAPRPTAASRSLAIDPAPVSSWTSSASFSRPTVPDLPAERWDAPVAPRPSSLRARLRSRRRLRALRRAVRGLWTVAGILAAIATGLTVAQGRTHLAACIQEPSVPADRRARVRLRGDDRPRAQVRIDMQALGVASDRECWISSGVHDFAWRPSPQEPWRSLGPHPLISAKEHLLRVGEDGLAITAYDP